MDNNCRKTASNKVLMCIIGLAICFLASPFTRVYGAEVKWPERFVIAAPSVGTVQYMLAVGMGEVIKKYTPVKYVQVMPLGGPAVWGPMMKKGEVDFAFQSGPDVIDLLLGKGYFSKIGPVPVRTVIGGSEYTLMFHTIPARNLKSISDLKGKVAYTAMMGQPMFTKIALAQLASAGLTFKDLKSSSTMPSIAQATSDLIEGKIDAFIYPVVYSIVQQINQSKGECVFINLTEKQANYIQDNNIGYYKCVIPEGKFANKKEMRYAICYQACLHGREDLDPQIVYEVAKAIMDHHSEWADCHPVAKEWGPDKGRVSTYTEPYHAGAIKYYKEKGLWTSKVQQHNDALLKQIGK